MRSSLVCCVILFPLFLFSQEAKKGTIHVSKNKLEGIYLYESEKGTKTYIKIFSDSTTMIANNSKGTEYMDFWFDRMVRDSNLPKGKIAINGNEIFVEIKIAQSKDDNMILEGTLFEEKHLKLRRVGKDFDNNYYIFYKQN